MQPSHFFLSLLEATAAVVAGGIVSALAGAALISAQGAVPPLQMVLSAGKQRAPARGEPGPVTVVART